MNIRKTINRTGLKIKKYSPEILTVVGVVSFVATVVTACKQTTKAHDILDKYHDEMEEINEAATLSKEDNLIDEMGNKIVYDQNDVKKDKFGVVARTTVGFIKLYSGPILLGAISITSFLSANHILKTRYVGAVAALNAISDAFDKYRQRVREAGGEELDRHFMYGTEESKIDIVEMTEDGKTHKSKEVVENVVDKNGVLSPYAKFFDESCPDWDKNPEFNMMFLQGQEAIANNMLHARGHLFLNEVYDMLGIERTSIGSVVGWIDGYGDSFVDFGLYESDNKAKRRFVNGLENVILLDFNVDGVIYDKI